MSSADTLGLKSIVASRILNDMLRCDTVKRQTRSDWKVLVMDQLATRIMSAACKMHDVMAEGITIVEDIFKDREPLPEMDAVYFISPTTETIDRLIGDFESRREPLYRAAHIFFTQVCDNENFERLSKSAVARYTKTLKEINVAFVPYEKQVFTLGFDDGLNMVYNPMAGQTRTTYLEALADQIATLCVTLQEYPKIRYRAEFVRNLEFGNILQSKLDQYKAEDPSLGQGMDKSKSILLIVDRGFDPVTAVIHDLSLQAMAYDLLPIEDDVYKFYSAAGQKAAAPDNSGTDLFKDVILTDGSELWLEIRHKHIASASQIVTKRLKEFAAEKHIKESSKSNIKDLGQLVKKLPQYQKELTAYSVHLQLIEDCMRQYQGKLDKICIVEQNLVMGTDAEGEKIKDHMKHIVAILLDNTVSISDKLRVIVLYILHKNGINEENLDKLLSHAMIPPEKRETILKLQLLNLQIIHDARWSSRKKNIPPVRTDRNESVYQTSRWTPYIKDIMEAIIEDKLDTRAFPSLGHRNPKVESVRGEYGGWYRGRNQMTPKLGPRLIVFVLGGLTYSEMRCAYEVTSSAVQPLAGTSRKWEVIIDLSTRDIIAAYKMADERAYELEALESIYYDDFSKQPDRNDGIERIRIRLRTVDVTLEFALGDTYPMEAAAECRYVKGGEFDESQVTELHQRASACANENKGSPSVFTIASCVEQWLEEIQDSKRNATKLEVDKLAELERQEELRKFEGQRVTAESFAKWLNEFTVEMALSNLGVNQQNDDQKQLTGKQMFERNRDIYLSDDLPSGDEDELFSDASDASLPIDESLFIDD